MKCLLIVNLLALLSLAIADTKTHSRGCRYIMGRCVEECEEGTHAYAIGCGQRLPEATCEEPNPVKEQGIMCDFSSCYCDAPTVRDTKSNKCVPLDLCPGNKLA